MNFFNWLISEWLGNVFNSLRLFVDWLAKPFSDPWVTLKKLWRPKVQSGLRSFFLLMLLVAVIVGLGALTYVTPARTWMDATKAPAFIRNFWMGWAALLFCIIIRLAIAVLRQLRVLSPAYHRFSDIDAAIQNGMQAAEAAGMPIDQVPVFLVVGLSRTAEREFNQSVTVGRDIRVDDANAPLHWYGSEKGLWITLPGISATSLQADLLDEARSTGSYVEPQSRQLVAVGADAEAGEEIAPHDVGRTISIGAFLAEDPDADAASSRRSRAMAIDVPTVTAKKLQRARDRLLYMCQALQRARYPVCTVNGVVLCVPFCEQVVSEKVSQQFRDCIKTDMTALQTGLGVRCMSAVVFTGCNDNAAFRSYIQSLPPQSISHRCGVSFPQLVELGDGDPDKAHAWLQRDFELQAMQLFKSRAGLPINEELFRFVDLIRQSRTYFTSVLRSAFLQPVAGPLSFAGVYFAELSPSGSVAHPFLQGVLVKLLREHDEVISWTPETLAQDARQKRLSRVLLVLSVLFMLSNVVLFWDLVSDKPILNLKW